MTNVLAVLPVADFVAALDWYERLFGRPPDVFPLADERLAEWQLTETAGIQVVDDAGRAGTAQVTVAVDDLARQVADLSARALPVGAAGGTATVADPAGNVITFAA